MIDMAREKLLEMGPNPDSWPIWPVLPLKSRTKKEGSIPLLGYVADYGLSGPAALPIVVRSGIIYAPKKDDPVLGTYQSWQEVVQDGWVVD